MYETRVNLKHLLEDIRDSYSIPIEEAILAELVANALDSKASKIEIYIDPQEKSLTVCDNGEGMRKEDLKEYHNIAATVKIKGKGIGFAGIGAKLALLISKPVITETKGGRGSRCATSWYLKDSNHAPWKFIPFSGKIQSPRGTAVSIFLSDDNNSLLSSNFVTNVIKKQYFPLFHPEFLKGILKPIYKKGVEFFVQGEKISLENSFIGDSFPFKITLGGQKTKKLVGFGYLIKSEKETSSDLFGISVSTYGKVIKRGWEWIGLLPKSVNYIYGLIEIPLLAEILTTTKNDFLKDSTNLKKYYRYRKAIQEAILPIFSKIGEERITLESNSKNLRPLEKQIEKAISYLLVDFPEIGPLVGVRKRKKTEEIEGIEEEMPKVKILESDFEEIKESFEEEKGENKIEKTDKEKSISEPGIKIRFESSETKELARMVENTIWINTNHPTFEKAKKEGYQEYHVFLSVGWTLSQFIEENHSPHRFISSFLASWALEEKKPFALW